MRIGPIDVESDTEFATKPLPQILQIRSDVLVAKSEKKVPSEHVVDTCDAQSVRIVPVDVESEFLSAKKPMPHSMQTLSSAFVEDDE